MVTLVAAGTAGRVRLGLAVDALAVAVGGIAVGAVSVGGGVAVKVRLITELPDGSRIEVTDPKIVPMGDAFAHRQLTYTHEGDADRPAFKIVLEVRNGSPVCASLYLGSPESGSHVRARDLNAIKLDDLRDDIYAVAGVFVLNPDGGGYIRKLGPASFKQDRKRVQNVTRRRKVTPEFLSQVADVHNGAPAGGRLEAVKAAFSVSERQALRYIGQAKQRGLIDG